MRLTVAFRNSFALVSVALFAACGGGGGDDAPPAQYTIGGTVSGLAGSGLALQNNGAGSLAVATNGTFAFTSAVPSATAYAVTVSAQPATPSQTCSVVNGSGTVGASSVSNIAVNCVTNSYTVGGTASGLAGSGLTLLNNGGGALSLTANGAFTFTSPVASGVAYGVTAGTQPTNPSQTCTVVNGTGTISSSNIATVEVACATNAFAVGGSVSGLSGSGLTLRNNGGNDLALNASGTFNFTNPVPSGATYQVTVAMQPVNPSQTCSVTNSSGMISISGISNVTVSCTTNSYGIGGLVSGLVGSGLTLQNNGTNPVPLSANGAFDFPGSVLSGSSYAVTVATQPTNPSQTCAVANDAGVVGGSNVSVTISCTTNAYAIGGTVSGLLGSNVRLQLNGGGDLQVAANGSFQFSGTVLSNASYVVSVHTQPVAPAQTCVLKAAAGTVTNAAIDSVRVICTAAPARFAYVGSQTGIYCFAIDAISGALVPFDNVRCATGFLVGVATDPSGRYVYATNAVSTQIHPYSINQATGALTRIPGAELPSGANPVSATVDPSGSFVYLGNYGGPAVSAYAIDGVTGAVAAVPGSPFAGGMGTNKVTVDPTGQFLYTANQNSRDVSAFTIDSGTGALSPIAGSPFALSGNAIAQNVAVDPATQFAFVTGLGTNTIHVFAINSTTGALTPVAGSPFATGTQPAGIAVDPSGSYVYVANNGANSISAYSLNSTTGSLTAISGSPFARAGNPGSLRIHPSGQLLYVSNNGNGTVATYSIDGTSGALTEISGSPVAASGSGSGGTYDIAIAQ
jgi:6-phosphogluconolactonase (cycloisomerase 2 family)